MNIEHYEYMDTILTEYREWLDFEEDMKSDPYGMADWDERQDAYWIEHPEEAEWEEAGA